MAAVAERRYGCLVGLMQGKFGLGGMASFACGGVLAMRNCL
jgi:hypothetical protein